MDNLLDLARKFDATNTPELREKLRAAIENSTAMEPAEQDEVDRLLVLGDQIRTLLGERYGEFEDRYAELITDVEPSHRSPAMATLRAIDLVVHASVGLSRGTHLIGIQVPESIPPGDYDSVLISASTGQVRILDIATDGKTCDGTCNEPTPFSIALPHRVVLGRRVDAGLLVSVELSVESERCAVVGFWFLRKTQDN